MQKPRTKPARVRRMGRLAHIPSAVLSQARSATRRMMVGARATKLATQTVSGRWIMDGSRRTRQFGIARRFGSRARKTGRLAHFPSAALTRTRSATRRALAGARATKLATQTPSGWMTAGSRPTKQFGIARSSVLIVPTFRLTPMPAMSLLPRARRQGSLANRPCVALSLARSATRRMMVGARATKLATQTVSGRWMMDGSRRTRQFGIARRFGPRARTTGRLAHFPSCCSDPYAKCYKKSAGWSSCNRTCDPNSKWMDDRWVKTNETVWDCEVISVDSTDVSTDSDAGNVAATPPRARRQGNLANRPCVALSLMRSATRRMIGGARATKLATQTVCGRSSCNQTCDPNSKWMDDRWVKTNETVWDCEVISVGSTDVSTDSDAGNVAATACSQTGQSCEQTMCCSEPGAKCYKKNDGWSSCNQTCDPNSKWTVDNGWVKTNETVWDCEEIRSCNQTCDPNSMWMKDRWVKTDNSVWDCKDLTVTPVESADPIKDAEAEDETGTCSQNGASCTHSKCCSEPGSKCYKKDDGWSSCNQTCDPNSKWTVDDGWVKTNETVWDCEEIRLPCTENGASCALSKCCSDPYAKCYKKSAGWSSCNQTCDPNSKWMDDRWVKTNETVWDCELVQPNLRPKLHVDDGPLGQDDNSVWDCKDLTVTPVESADPIKDAEAEDENGTCSQNGASCTNSKCCSEPGSKCYKKDDDWSSCNQTCNPYYVWTEDNGWVKTNETVWDCEEIRLPCTENGASCALSKCCSDPYAKCYKKSAGWSSCNRTCDPNSKWMDDRWVKTNETVWDCEVISVDSTDVSTDSDAGNVAATDVPADSASSSDASTASACSQTGQSCEQTMCCSEPDAKCYKKNDWWSSCNQTCDPNSMWTEDNGWVKTDKKVWDCEEIRLPCTENGASCALSKCCSDPYAKCYKKNAGWSSCNRTCDPNSMWMKDRWVKTDNSVWDCEVISIEEAPKSVWDVLVRIWNIWR
ncbi:unnamed protein product [Prorocentrum cordatum]|uniref:Cellulase n=2 Tax=Prorocentrum cordatum TaxID=2364126 RepID=A0ABN9SYL4_9DINO|nr:unnamed protein product [Polarella glacialis]